MATGLTKHLAVEWADRGIRVNAVAPGQIRTERAQTAPGRAGRAEYLAEIEWMHPMGRIGEPAEVAGSAIVFLASDDASFITGCRATEGRCDRYLAHRRSNPLRSHSGIDRLGRGNREESPAIRDATTPDLCSAWQYSCESTAATYGPPSTR